MNKNVLELGELDVTSRHFLITPFRHIVRDDDHLSIARRKHHAVQQSPSANNDLLPLQFPLPLRPGAPVWVGPFAVTHLSPEGSGYEIQKACGWNGMKLRTAE